MPDPTLADTAAEITAWSTVGLAIIATGALIASAVMSWLTWKLLAFEQRQATVTRRRSLPRLGIERIQPPSQGSVASGILCFVSGTDPALTARVLVRRGTVYWYATFDRPIVPFTIPKDSQGWDGPGAFAAGMVKADRQRLVADMPKANGARDEFDGCAVIAAWSAPDGTELWCAQRYQVATPPPSPAPSTGDMWKAVGPEIFGSDPPL